MEEKILVTGCSGQLGKALQRIYPNAKFTDSTELDISDQPALDKFDWAKYDVIINAAAYTKVDGCETAEGRIIAWRVNAQAVSNLAKICSKNNILLVHFSSDYVFDGNKQKYIENDDLSPQGVYGQTKAAADLAVATCPNHYIIRTSWVIGDGKNFIRSMIGLAEKNISPNVVADQFGRPTFTTELARGVKHLLDKKADHGIYNLTNEGDTTSWADIARQVYAELGRNDLKVGDTTAAEYFAGKISSPRPTNSTLDLAKIKSTGFRPMNWNESLKLYIKENE